MASGLLRYARNDELKLSEALHLFVRHCEERGDVAIQCGSRRRVLDCFATLAMTNLRDIWGARFPLTQE